jgi:hypothetical protein
MAATVTKQEDKISRALSGPSSRTEVLVRYRHLRAINRRLQREAVNFLRTRPCGSTPADSP